MRKLAIVLAAVAAVVLSAGPAFAHVTITPPEAVQGSDAVLGFNVPNEMDNANTTQVEIDFPTDHPIAAADVKPIPGWTATVDKATVSTPIKTDSGDVTEAVSKVTWAGGAITPGQFQQFVVSVGLPDDATSLEFKTLQTYSNGQVVRWIESTPSGGPEPENPAPVLTLVKSAGSDAHDAAASTSTETTSDSSSDSDTAKTLAIVGIVVGALGVILGGVALARSRRSKAA